jgi:hypothetical protein
MKKYCFLIFFIFLQGDFVQAQTPYTWTFKATKVADRTYDIHSIADVQAPWHTYSQFTPDGGPLPTKFSFSRNPLYTLDGIVKENGNLVIRHEEVFGVDVKYFEGKVDFVQRVKIKGSAKTNFTGTVEFMVCNEQQCLPPATQKFTVALN